jgi:diketogulonate reductase-like aldo/keto reductase
MSKIARLGDLSQGNQGRITRIGASSFSIELIQRLMKWDS